MSLADEIKNKYKQVNGVYYIDEPQKNFEELYIKLREAEGRIYSDDQVKQLPEISPNHRHYNEWLVRKKSSKALINYLRNEKKNKAILELGCGNGWLTNKLTELPGSQLIGLDVNISELEQGARVFGSKQNLVFVCSDVFKIKFKFDYIILAGVIAYFKDLDKLISSLISNLNPNGEIHIIDSPFYKDTGKAKQNSARYYSDLGFEEMINYYHHHSLDGIKQFKYEILNNPNSIIEKIKRKLGSSVPPFYWIKITT
jgi:SAM-dependent methyltransferase